MVALELPYQRAHRRVARERGLASEHNCSCGNRALDWAHQHGSDPDDPANYKPMCRKCHQTYDEMVYGQKGEDHPRAKLTKEDVIELRDMYASGGYTQKELAEIFGIHKGNVAQIVNRYTWKHV